MNNDNKNIPVSPPQNISQLQNSLINQLKTQISAYENTFQEQNKKLIAYDNLIIDYNSLNNNYTELENELKSLKSENNQLKNIINNKNKTISEFQNLFNESKTKFYLLNQLNTSLQSKIDDLEKKLREVPNTLQTNNMLLNKINEYEKEILRLKDENKKREEIFKFQLDSQEKIIKKNSDEYEDEIKGYKSDINNLKFDNNNLKKINNDLENMLKSKEKDFRENNFFKQKENEKLTKNILDIKDDLTKMELNYKTKLNDCQNVIEKLTDQVNNLNNIITNKENDNQKLIKELEKVDNFMQQSGKEIKERENTLNNLKLKNKELEEKVKQLEIRNQILIKQDKKFTTENVFQIPKNKNNNDGKLIIDYEKKIRELNDANKKLNDKNKKLFDLLKKLKISLQEIRKENKQKDFVGKIFSVKDLNLPKIDEIISICECGCCCDCNCDCNCVCENCKAIGENNKIKNQVSYENYGNINGIGIQCCMNKTYEYDGSK